MLVPQKSILNITMLNHTEAKFRKLSVIEWRHSPKRYETVYCLNLIKLYENISECKIN